MDSPEKKIAAFLEKTENGISALHANFSELQAILLHEIFIYTIAYFIRLEKYGKVAYILGKTYYFNKYTNNLYSFEIFIVEIKQILIMPFDIGIISNTIQG